MLLVEVGKKAAMLQCVEVHFKHRRRDPNTLKWHTRIFATSESHAADTHFGGDQAEQGRALTQGDGIGHGAARGLIGQVFLLSRHVLFLQPDLVRAANGDHAFPHAVLHAFDDGGHADEARHAQDDAQHGEKRAEFVGPDFFQADGDGGEEGHGKAQTE